MEELVGHPSDAHKLAFVLGGVSGDEKVRIHDHLQGCNACRQHVGEMAEVRRKEVLEEVDAYIKKERHKCSKGASYRRIFVARRYPST